MIIRQINDLALLALEGAGVISVVRKQIVSVVLGHLFNVPDHFGAEIVTYQVVHELTPFL